jgi:hypothetical protein
MYDVTVATPFGHLPKEAFNVSSKTKLFPAKDVFFQIWGIVAEHRERQHQSHVPQFAPDHRHRSSLDHSALFLPLSAISKTSIARGRIFD